MRPFCLLALYSILAIAPSARAGMPGNDVPVAQRQSTGDPWDVGGMSPREPCQRILSELAFPVAAAQRGEAEALLRKASVQPLDDNQAASLLDRKGADKLFADLLTARVTAIQGEPNASLADKMVAHDLIEVERPHYPPYRPYLVRALAGPRTAAGNFTINLCGATLLVDNLSDGDRASRLPTIVFLQTKPAAAIPSWYR